MSAQQHQSDPRILGRRTLERDHRSLAPLLRPGLSVLDVGCGVGSITSGIATRVGPKGRVVGLDRDAGLIELARTGAIHAGNLTYEYGSITDAAYDGQFDIVTAARTLQWIAEPERAVAAMKRAARRGGLVVILDYNHARNGWEPAPPEAFAAANQAFLDWRAANGWDNLMGDHLAGLLEGAGLEDVSVQDQDEVTERDDTDFAERSNLWIELLENVGAQLTGGGFLSEAQLTEARDRFAAWKAAALRRQTLSLRSVVGKLPL